MKLSVFINLSSIDLSLIVNPQKSEVFAPFVSGFIFDIPALFHLKFGAVLDHHICPSPL